MRGFPWGSYFIRGEEGGTVPSPLEYFAMSRMFLRVLVNFPVPCSVCLSKQMKEIKEGRMIDMQGSFKNISTPTSAFQTSGVPEHV